MDSKPIWSWLDFFGALVFWRLMTLNRPVCAEYLDQIADAIVALGRPPQGVIRR